MAGLWIIGLVLLALSGCGAPSSDENHPELMTGTDDTIATAKRTDPSLQKFFDTSVGYVVFPSVGKGGIGIWHAYGKGVVYQHRSPIGYAAMTQASIGLQLGGQAYTEIIFFETKPALESFEDGTFTFAAQATAVAVKAGPGADSKYSDHVAVFTMSESGLMYEASIGGQKFSYAPIEKQ